MHPQDTDLERRVLAHERILQFLLAELARENSAFSEALMSTFSPQGRRSHQHEFTDADDHAEAFVRQVIRLNDNRRPNPKSVVSDETRPTASARSAKDADIDVAVAFRSGVWEIRRASNHFGDYLSRSTAIEAALQLALRETASGIKIKLVVDNEAVLLVQPGCPLP